MLSILVTGTRINNREMASKFGQTELALRVSFIREWSMAKGNLLGLMVLLMLENSMRIESKGWDFILGQMEGCIKVVGKIIRCMVRVN